MFWIIYMSRLTTGTIHFNNRNIFPLPQLFPAIKANIQPAIIKSIYLPANFINCICQLFINEVTNVNKFCAPYMISIRNKNSFFPFLQNSSQFITAGFSQRRDLQDKSLILFEQLYN